jgi:hypothetical protein
VHVGAGVAGADRTRDAGEVTGRKPCATGPTTSAAVMVPVTVPEVATGHAGSPPPQKKNTMTPPLILLGLGCPASMTDAMRTTAGLGAQLCRPATLRADRAASRSAMWVNEVEW